MTSMLLADTNSIWSWVLIVIVVLLLIALPIMMNARNKRETQKIQEQTNSLKVGDKILTTSGVYGTITELQFDDSKKVVVIETGGKTKSYMTVDAYAIYTVFKSEAELKREAEAKAEAERARLAEEEAKREAKKNKKKKVVEETSNESTASEPVVEEVKEEVAEKKTSKKSKKD